MSAVTRSRAAALALMALCAAPAAALDVTGAGATFPYPVYARWADAYRKETGVRINYQSIGSGAGVRQILARTVTFGATDAPLSPERLAREGLVQWPQLVGAIVPIVNLAGVGPGELVLDGATLGDIFLGKVTRWDDAAITRLNPALRLPAAPITVVRRSDGSGATFNFTTYLAAVNAEWKARVGVGSAVEWPVGVGAKGNEGVAANVGQIRNAIGYVEFAYARHGPLAFAALVNRAGRTLLPSPETFEAAAANADWAHAPGYRVLLTNQPGDRAWPMTAATFILMPTRPADGVAAARALEFFGFAFANGDAMARELGYSPMPAPVKALIRATWAKEIVLR